MICEKLELCDNFVPLFPPLLSLTLFAFGTPESPPNVLSGPMSRSDYPPVYDDSRGALYAPQGGNYPPPPAYGFPSYGGPQPPAPYPTGPSAPLFPGQPGGFPGASYQGQPHHGGPPGPGYPSPPPMPPVMPATISSDMLSSGKMPFEFIVF